MRRDHVGFASALCLGVLLAWSGTARAATTSAAAEDGISSKAIPSRGRVAAVVDITDRLRFEPTPVEIEVGEVVEWKNASVLVHTVTGDPSLAQIEGSASLPAAAVPFNSGNLEPEATFRHRFDVSGTYQYFCIPHEAAKMIGRVIVHAKGTL